MITGAPISTAQRAACGLFTWPIARGGLHSTTVNCTTAPARNVNQLGGLTKQEKKTGCKKCISAQWADQTGEKITGCKECKSAQWAARCAGLRLLRAGLCPQRAPVRGGCCPARALEQPPLVASRATGAGGRLPFAGACAKGGTGRDKQNCPT